MSLSETPALRGSKVRFRLILMGVAMPIGALLGHRLLGSALIGSLVGLLVAWRIAEMRLPGGGASPAAQRFPNALVCLLLAAGSWFGVLLVWGWMLTKAPGVFQGEGGAFITFIVFPLSLFGWLVGGPAASAAGRSALKQIQAGMRPRTDLWMARTGLALSRAASLIVLVLLLWLIALMFFQEGTPQS